MTDQQSATPPVQKVTVTFEVRADSEFEAMTLVDERLGKLSHLLLPQNDSTDIERGTCDPFEGWVVNGLESLD